MMGDIELTTAMKDFCLRVLRGGCSPQETAVLPDVIMELHAMSDLIEVPPGALVCAARHLLAAHESAKNEVRMDSSAPCRGCPIYEPCRANWLKTAAPIFEAANVSPDLSLQIS